jgi:uncharacterized coiled-coil DUF342 family protein
MVERAAYPRGLRAPLRPAPDLGKVVMSDDDKHKARLEQAVTRLEEALGEVAKKADAGAGAAAKAVGERDKLAEQVQNLTAENESLRAELTSARNKHDELRLTTEAVSDRLDATISELTKIMG